MPSEIHKSSPWPINQPRLQHRPVLGGTAQTAILLLPLAWCILNGPHVGIAFAIGTIGSLIFICWENRLGEGKRQYWLIGLAILYAIMGEAFPKEMLLAAQSLDVTTLLSATFYAIVTGKALAQIARKGCLLGVLHGFLIIAACLALLAFRAIETINIGDLVKISDNGIRWQTAESEPIFGIFSDSNFLFFVVGLTVTAAAGIGCITVRMGWPARSFYLLTVLAAVYCNYATGTRTVILGTAFVSVVTVGIVLIHRRTSLKRRLFLVGSITLIVAGVGIVAVNNGMISDAMIARFGRTTDDSRFDYWRLAVNLIIENPLGGGYRYFYLHYWAHNHVLDVGLVYGVLGSVVVTAIYLIVLWKGARLVFRHDFGEGSLALYDIVLMNCVVAFSLPPKLGLYVLVLALGIMFGSLPD